LRRWPSIETIQGEGPVHLLWHDQAAGWDVLAFEYIDGAPARRTCRFGFKLAVNPSSSSAWAEFIPRQVIHLQQILKAFPLISGTTAGTAEAEDHAGEDGEGGEELERRDGTGAG
jgi:hypothetical protein